MWTNESNGISAVELFTGNAKESEPIPKIASISDKE